MQPDTTDNAKEAVDVKQTHPQERRNTRSAMSTNSHRTPSPCDSLDTVYRGRFPVPPLSSDGNKGV